MIKFFRALLAPERVTVAEMFPGLDITFVDISDLSAALAYNEVMKLLEGKSDDDPRTERRLA